MRPRWCLPFLVMPMLAAADPPVTVPVAPAEVGPAHLIQEVVVRRRHADQPTYQLTVFARPPQGTACWAVLEEPAGSENTILFLVCKPLQRNGVDTPGVIEVDAIISASTVEQATLTLYAERGGTHEREYALRLRDFRDERSLFPRAGK